MRVRVHLAAAALVLAWTPSSWAINKCTGPDGKVVFQDALCAGKGEVINVRPASGAAPVRETPALASSSVQPIAVATPAPKPLSEAERIEAEVAKSQKARRKRDLEVVAIPNARSALRGHTNACNQQQNELRAKKRRANDNLAGAVWESSISEEMSAAARECATRSNQLISELEALRQECTAMNCVPEGQ